MLFFFFFFGCAGCSTFLAVHFSLFVVNNYFLSLIHGSNAYTILFFNSLFALYHCLNKLSQNQYLKITQICNLTVLGFKTSKIKCLAG